MVTAGFVACVGAAAIMLLDVVGIGWGSAIGVVGIGLLASAAAPSNAAASDTDAR